MKLTEFLGVYGAVVSSLTLLWNVSRTRPSVKVNLIYGVEAERSGVYVFVRNKSAHPVRISAITILYRSGNRSIWEAAWDALRYRNVSRYQGWVHWAPSASYLDTGCPVTLAPSDAHKFLIPDEVAEGVLAASGQEGIVAAAQDALWNVYYSNRYRGYGRRAARKLSLWRSR